MLEEYFKSLIDSATFKTFKTTALSYFNELRNFHFSLFNPLLWVIFCAVFLLLLRQWGHKKSFSFCSTITALLLFTTWLENSISSKLAASEIFDFTIIKLICLFVIMLISLYYFFIRGD